MKLLCWLGFHKWKLYPYKVKLGRDKGKAVDVNICRRCYKWNKRK